MKKDQHYVPQFYLKSWDESGKLTAFDPKLKKFKRIAPQNICFEKNLYETPAKDCCNELGKYISCNDIENTFCKYENDYANLLKNLLNICTEKNKKALILHSNEKKMFFSFVVNMLIRNPVSMRNMELDTLSDEITKSEFYSKLDYVLKKMRIGATESIFKAAQKKAYLTFEYENPLIEELERLDYCFLLAQKGEFITSDHPVCYGNDLYIKTENSTCLYMALSPQIAVLFGNYEDSKSRRNRMILIPENLVDELNKSIIEKQHYYKWIIAHSQSAIEKAIKE